MCVRVCMCTHALLCLHHFVHLQWISDNKSEIEEKGSKDLLEGGEFKVLYPTFLG